MKRQLELKSQKMKNPEKMENPEKMNPHQIKEKKNEEKLKQPMSYERRRKNGRTIIFSIQNEYLQSCNFMFVSFELQCCFAFLFGYSFVFSLSIPLSCIARFCLFVFSNFHFLM
jgi:hypothetical protein